MAIARLSCCSNCSASFFIEPYQILRKRLETHCFPHSRKTVCKNSHQNLVGIRVGSINSRVSEHFKLWHPDSLLFWRGRSAVSPSRNVFVFLTVVAPVFWATLSQGVTVLLKFRYYRRLNDCHPCVGRPGLTCRHVKQCVAFLPLAVRAERLNPEPVWGKSNMGIARFEPDRESGDPVYPHD